MNCRLVKAKFSSLRILLDLGASSNIFTRKHKKKPQKINTKPVLLSNQGSDFNTSLPTKVEIFLPRLNSKIIVMWNLHMYDSQGHHRYGMILGT